MKAVTYRQSLPIDDPHSLLDVVLPDPPAPTGRDLLVRVQAVSVNPVDTKIRRNVDPAGADKVLGWDAAGTVVAAGPEATLFKPGDAVFYAGAIDRPGSNAELQLVDERIVGRKPATLDAAQAAALPLTTITAWELLFDRLGVARGDQHKTLLVVGAAGGVGSMAVQIARKLTGLTVIGTASRPKTQAWVHELGAHHVVDHRAGLLEPVRAVAPEVFDVDRHWIPPRKADPGHYHYDLRFLLEADPAAPLVRAHAESKELAWVELARVTALNPEESMARMVRKTRPA